MKKGYAKHRKSGKGGVPSGTTIHSTSISGGTGSGNLYSKVKPSIDNENPPGHKGYGV